MWHVETFAKFIQRERTGRGGTGKECIHQMELPCLQPEDFFLNRVAAH